MSAGRVLGLALALASALAASLPLGACGKRPGSVLAPQGEESDSFPRIYPPPEP